MKIALMTFEGELHKIVEWNGKTEHKGMYLSIPNEPECNHFNAVLAIRPEDVNEYVNKVREYKQQIMNLQSEMIQFKATMHHKLIPLKG